MVSPPFVSVRTARATQRPSPKGVAGYTVIVWSMQMINCGINESLASASEKSIAAVKAAHGFRAEQQGMFD